MKRISEHVTEETPAIQQDGRALPPQGLPRRAFFRARAAQVVSLHSPHMNQTELTERLRHFGLFEQIPAGVLRVVAAGATLQALHQGEVLWRRGDPARHVVLIDSGFVKASRQDRNGASKTYGLFGPGDSMGLYALWVGMRYPTDAIALNEGVILISIDAGVIYQLADKHRRLSRNLKGEVTRFSEAFINKIEIISAGSIEQRLAVLLLYLVSQYGVDRRGEKARLPIFLTLVQISEIIDARFETVARALGHWRRAGWLTTDADGWHFNSLDKLRKLSND